MSNCRWRCGTHLKEFKFHSQIHINHLPNSSFSVPVTWSENKTRHLPLVDDTLLTPKRSFSARLGITFEKSYTVHECPRIHSNLPFDNLRPSLGCHKFSIKYTLVSIDHLPGSRQHTRWLRSKFYSYYSQSVDNTYTRRCRHYKIGDDFLPPLQHKPSNKERPYLHRNFFNRKKKLLKRDRMISLGWQPTPQVPVSEAFPLMSSDLSADDVKSVSSRKGLFYCLIHNPKCQSTSYGGPWRCYLLKCHKLLKELYYAKHCRLHHPHLNLSRPTPRRVLLSDDLYAQSFRPHDFEPRDRVFISKRKFDDNDYLNIECYLRRSKKQIHKLFVTDDMIKSLTGTISRPAMKKLFTSYRKG